jgi:hypothetical protein
VTTTARQFKVCTIGNKYYSVKKKKKNIIALLNQRGNTFTKEGMGYGV